MRFPFLDRAATDPASPPPANRQDCFSAFHLILQSAFAVLIFFSGEIDRIYNLWLQLVLVVGVPAIFVASIWFISVIFNLFKRRWRRLVSALAAPLIVFGWMWLLAYWEFDAQWVRFQVNRRAYAETLHVLGSPRHFSWDWGGTGGAAVADISRQLIYDESGQVLLRATLHGADPERGDVTVRSFGDHFYLVTRIFQ